MSKDQNKINCPKCNEEININDTLYSQMVDAHEMTDNLLLRQVLPNLDELLESENEHIQELADRVKKGTFRPFVYLGGCGELIKGVRKKYE